MKNYLNKEFWLGIFIFLILSLTPLLWFKENSMLIGNDNIFPLDFNEFLRDRLFTWSENHGLGYDQSSGMGSIILHTIDSLPYFLGFSPQTTQKIVYCFWFFALLFSAFIFCWKIEKWGYISSKYFKYILPVLYTFNFYTLQAWSIGERTKFELLVALPIFLLILVSLLKAKTGILKHAIYAGLLLSIFNGGGWKGVTLYGGLLISIFCFLTYVFFIRFENTRKQIIKKYTLFFLFFSFIFFLFNAYSLFPFLSHTLSQYKTELINIGGAGNVKGWIDMISHDASLTNLFRFQGIPEWYDASHLYPQQYLHNPILIAISYLFIVCIFISVFLRKNAIQKKFYFYFFFLFLLSLIFTAGSHPPFGFFYLFLAEHIPGFAIFRSPIYKFGYAYWFAGAFLISYTLSYLIDLASERFYKKQTMRYVSGGIITLFITVFLILYHNPFLKGNIFMWSNNTLENRVEVPQYIFQTAKWIKEENDGSRILLLPRANDNWKGDTYTWKFFSLYPILANISRQPFLYNNDSLTGNESYLVNSLYDAILSKDIRSIYLFSDILRVKYLIVRNDFYYNLSWSKTESPKAYTKVIKENPAFSYERSFGEWDIYVLKRNYYTSHTYPYNYFSTYNEKENFIPVVNFLSSNISSVSAEKTVLVNSNDTNNFSKTLLETMEKNIYFYNCITCDVMSNSIEIQFPTVHVLPTSPFYKILDIIKNFKKKEPIVGEKEGYHYLGEALRYTEELRVLQINFYNKNRETREAGVKKTIDILTELYSKIDIWLNTSINTEGKRIQHYKKILTYLTEQEMKINAFLEKDTENLATGNPTYFPSLQKLLVVFNNLKQKVTLYTKNINYIDEKIYFPQTVPNNYDIYIQYGKNIPSELFTKSYLEIEQIRLSPVSYMNNVVYYGSHFLNPEIPIVMQLPQNNLGEQLTDSPVYKPLELQRSACTVSQVHNVKKTDNYRITINYLNDFSDRLRFIIYTLPKYQKELDKSVIIYADELNQDERFIAKDFNFIPPLNMEEVFIGVCSNGITKEAFQNKIKMEIKNVYSPGLLLVINSNSEKSVSSLTPYTIEKINQTKYKINFTKVTQPFLLAFYEKYNTDWKAYVVSDNSKNAKGKIMQNTIFEESFFTTWFKKPISENQHIILNGYMNGWYVDSPGNYSVIIEYRPQMLFYQGLIISGFTLIIGFILLLKRNT